ncbi:acyltransferase family protein [Phytomonospora endophytica]|uniref:Peptidoglycan/LPS O-acetylase OafA/YrhL n=1 Tax=Phytomonospora endophytica TaxID=714109 RepID=A0A841FN84_9ACTN|nr:acyltransferase family protein [Phytomonospora endophytica]MBB6037566.1 peptidoglycan/LPS O-acetylase OafA/YrhL [Phytomonospora endophytica]GIG70267.1 acyltransferase [Phytomonospora endophytica]
MPEQPPPFGATGPPPAPERDLRLDVQGLRALAVGLVVASHAGIGFLGGGYVGVDVFFVISGFLITALLVRELSAGGGLSFRRFYARRALRLLPAAILVIVATLAGARLFLSKLRFEEYVGDALGSLFYAENIRLAATGTDYLAEGAPPSPFQHFWSLAVEEQFYLLWPVVLLLGWKVFGLRRKGLAVLLAALCLASFGLSASTTSNDPSWAYFGIHTRLWELGAGALLALSAARLKRLPSGVAAVLGWAGMAAIVVSAVAFDDATSYPGHLALLPTAGAALVLAGGCSPSRGDARLVLTLKPAVWVGGVSYGWYLWHWPLLVIGPMALGMRVSVRLSLALAAIALLLAWGTLRLVENPLRFHRAFRRRPWRALGVGLGLSASATAVILVASVFPPAISSGAAAPVLAEVIAAAPDPQARLTRILAESGGGLPSNLTPALTEVKGERSAIYRDGCHVSYESATVERCVYGDVSSSRTVVLFGDSHAAQWFPALERLALAGGWRLVSLTKASCKVATVTIIRRGADYASCDEWRSAALEVIAELRPALVVASSSDAGDPARAGNPLALWTSGYRETFAALTATGAEVAVLLDTAWPDGDAVECAARHPLDLAACTASVPASLRDPVRRQAIRDAAGPAGVTVIDPVPWLCRDGGECPVVVGDTFVYRDDSHLAEAYTAAIAPVLGARITTVWPESEAP